MTLLDGVLNYKILYSKLIMADNVSMLRKNLADKYYLRNKINFKKSKKNSEQLLNCLKITGIKPKSILEIDNE